MKDVQGAGSELVPTLQSANSSASNRTILGELRDREVLRTKNAPVGDYAEWLVARALGVQRLEADSTASYELESEEFGKVQVKSRIVATTRRWGSVSDRPIPSDKFDHAALVLINAVDYTVQRAVMLPVAVVQERWNWRKNVNGWTFNMSPPKLSRRLRRGHHRAASRGCPAILLAADGPLRPSA